jgi:hypothetical protein
MTGRSRVPAFAGVLVAIGCIAFVQPLAAQSIVNPTTVEFDPSPDHSATLDGTPVVDRYEMEIYVQGAASPLQTLNLNKPAPGAGGKIRVNFVALLPTPLPAGQTYTALVTAVGPGGRGSSAMAPDIFSFSVPCSYSASPTNPPSAAAAGGSASVAVTATAGCAWTATEASSWVTITGGASGSGNGTVSYTVDPNPATSPRSTTMTVAGVTVTITQAAAPCSFSVSPLNPASLAHGGGNANVSVTDQKC